MAWIHSDQRIARHPKTIELAETMGWDIHETIGRLHALWWWCLDYAPDGCIGRLSADCRVTDGTASGELSGECRGNVGPMSGQCRGNVGPMSADTSAQTPVWARNVALAVGATTQDGSTTTQDGSRVALALVQIGWLDVCDDGRLVVHDWLDYAGTWLRDSKYRREVQKYKDIQALHATVVSREAEKYARFVGEMSGYCRGIVGELSGTDKIRLDYNVKDIGAGAPPDGAGTDGGRPEEDGGRPEGDPELGAQIVKELKANRVDPEERLAARRALNPKHPDYLFTVPEWLATDVWDQYIVMRVKIKKPATEYAKYLVAEKLDDYRKAGNDPTAVLHQSIVNNWRDVYPLKGDSRGKAGNADKSGGDKPTDDKWKDFKHTVIHV